MYAVSGKGMSLQALLCFMKLTNALGKSLEVSSPEKVKQSLNYGVLSTAVGRGTIQRFPVPFSHCAPKKAARQIPII